MVRVPKRVAERLVDGIKRFQPILDSAKARDIGEADTVTIVKDMLAEVFGYDKFAELTSEYAIRGTYCDLAIKLDSKLTTLIEVKPVGSDLKEPQVKQAVDYAANLGIDWVLLTNGVRWCVYHVTFTRPIGQELVVDIDFSALNPRADGDVEAIYLWCKEGWQRSALGEYAEHKRALNRFLLGAIVRSDPVLEVVRRELRRMSPDVRIDAEQIHTVLVNEVLKREVTDGDKAEDARKKIARAATKSLRASPPKEGKGDGPASGSPATAAESASTGSTPGESGAPAE
jgi:hypothetical protein